MNVLLTNLHELLFYYSCSPVLSLWFSCSQLVLSECQRLVSSGITNLASICSKSRYLRHFELHQVWIVLLPLLFLKASPLSIQTITSSVFTLEILGAASFLTKTLCRSFHSSFFLFLGSGSLFSAWTSLFRMQENIYSDSSHIVNSRFIFFGFFCCGLRLFYLRRGPI